MIDSISVSSLNIDVSNHDEHQNEDVVCVFFLCSHRKSMFDNITDNILLLNSFSYGIVLNEYVLVQNTLQMCASICRRANFPFIFIHHTPSSLHKDCRRQRATREKEIRKKNAYILAFWWHCQCIIIVDVFFFRFVIIVIVSGVILVVK